jgi:HPt (histidine-containing phosphotransfer) domain-containing protein
MASRKKDEPVVTTHADHDVIVPPNRLRKALRRHAADAIDPVARAEQALAALSVEFSGWMDSECARLDAARLAIRDRGMSERTREALFHAAHDIKGEAETFGFPLAAAAAASLCRLLEGVPEGQPIPLILIDQHVDAVRAIVREHAQPDAEQTAAQLTAKLREVTADFLRSVNGGQDEDVQSPPTVPHAAGN